MPNGIIGSVCSWDFWGMILLMFKWPGEVEKVQRLDARPDFATLKRIMAQSSQKQGVKTTFAWQENTLQREYQVSVKYMAKTYSFEWTLYFVKNQEKVKVWTEVSDSATTIVERITQSINNPGEDQKTSTSQRPQPFEMTSSRMSAARKILEKTYDSVPSEELEQLTVKKAALNGNLKVLNITNLLQSISLGRMSGKLSITRPGESVQIFFNDGRPVHAEGNKGQGEECFLKIISWKTGDFTFEEQVATKETTISRSLELLILEGVLLMDFTDFLDGAGYCAEAVLQRSDPNLSEAQFEDIVTKGEPVDLRLLKTIYLQVDGKKTIEDLCSIIRMPDSLRIHAFTNLLKTKVLKVSSTKPVEKKSPVIAKVYDISAISAIQNQLTNQISGLYTYQAFLFLTDYAIKFSPGQNLALLLCKLQNSPYQERTNPGNTSRINIANQYRDLVKTIESVQEFNGVVFQYDGGDIVVSISGLNSFAAANIAERVLRATQANPVPGKLLVKSMGVACFPHDGSNLGLLLGALEAATEKSQKQSDSPIFLAKDL